MSASSASAGQTGTQSQEAAVEGNISSTPKARPAHKSTSSKNTLPSQPNLQPWGNAGATPKSKWKKLDYIVSSLLCCEFQVITTCFFMRCEVIKVLLDKKQSGLPHFVDRNLSRKSDDKSLLIY